MGLMEYACVEGQDLGVRCVDGSWVECLKGYEYFRKMLLYDFSVFVSKQGLCFIMFEWVKGDK